MKDIFKGITRLEVIDHRQCVWCRGRLTENRLVGDEYKEMPCSKCDGSGIMGGRQVIFHNDQADISSRLQDDGKTMKVFINDRKKL